MEGFTCCPDDRCPDVFDAMVVVWAATTTALLLNDACASLKGMLTGKAEELWTADISDPVLIHVKLQSI